MRVLVTGGSGFLGRYVLRELVASGHHPVALARSATAVKEVSAAGAEPITGDLDDPATLDEAFAGAKADALANIASLGFGHAPTIVAAAEDAGLERALFVSTTAIFTSLQAPSKAVRTAAEDTIRSSSLAWTIVRPTMIYGAPGDRNMERLLALLRRSPLVPLPGGGRRLIQPVHVADLARFVVTVLEADTAGSEFDVGGPEALSLRTVVEQSAAAVRRRPIVVSLPLQPAVTALRIYERTTAKPKLKVEQVLRLDEDKAFDISAALSVGYGPRSFEEGIRDEAREMFVPAVGIGTYLRTAAHLRPEQIPHRIRLRVLRKLDAWRPAPLPPPPADYPGWPAGFRSLEADLDHGDPAAIGEGRFTFLGEQRRLGYPADWDQADAPRLWRFNLHYFEWAWALAQAGDREAFAQLWRSWISSTTIGHRDAWAPYVASLRAWVLCDVFDSLVRGTELEQEVAASLEQHLAFLERRLELDVGGNHLIKNLKALAGLGVFLRERSVVERCRSLLSAQLSVQVLSDGGHFERSPSYHCQVLGDLFDVAKLLGAARQGAVEGLDDTICRMQRWLGTVLGPDGEIPMCNDAGAVGADRISRLQPTPIADRLVVLADSGYVVARPDARTMLFADIGEACPPDLPAHAHADCLSFELWIDNQKAVTDTGTSTYESGPRRVFERSTAAHNTVEIDDADQTEVWSAFRAGRRAHGTLESAHDDGQIISITGSHNGYRYISGSPFHRRTWILRPGQLCVRDGVEGRGRHTIVSRIYTCRPGDSRMTIRGNGGPTSVHQTLVATDFGRLIPASCHGIDLGSVHLPASTSWLLTW